MIVQPCMVWNIWKEKCWNAWHFWHVLFFVFGTKFVYEISCNDITWSYKLKEKQANASRKLPSHDTLPWPMKRTIIPDHHPDNYAILLNLFSLFLLSKFLFTVTTLIMHNFLFCIISHFLLYTFTYLRLFDHLLRQPKSHFNLNW